MSNSTLWSGNLHLLNLVLSCMLHSILRGLVVNLVGGLHCNEKICVVISWIVTSYSLISNNQICREPATSVIRIKEKMEAEEFFETMVNTYETRLFSKPRSHKLRALIVYTVLTDKYKNITLAVFTNCSKLFSFLLSFL